MNAYCIYDSKSQTHQIPFFQKNDGLAIRAVLGSALDPESQLGKFGADFTLFHVGEFIDDHGDLIPMNTKRNLGTVREMIDTHLAE